MCLFPLARLVRLSNLSLKTMRIAVSESFYCCPPERSSHLFASGVERSTRVSQGRAQPAEALSEAEGDFFFLFQAHRFALIPPRARFGCASLPWPG